MTSTPLRNRVQATAALVIAALLAVVAVAFLGPGRAGAQGTDLEPPTITSTNSATFTVGQQGTFTVSTTPGTDENGDGQVSLEQSGALPGGVTFVDNGDGTGTLSGVPDDGTGGTYPLTFTASNGVSPDASQNFTLSVLEPPTITSSDATSLTVGQSGSFTVTTSPGFNPSGNGVVLSAPAQDFPGRVTFTDNGDGTATIAGTPDAGTVGTYEVTITASNGVMPDATQAFTLTIDPEPSGPTSVSVAGPSSLNAGATYEASASAPGAVPAATFSFVMGAPSWLHLDASTGALSGTPPSGTTSFSYQVSAFNSSGRATSAVESVTVVVAPTSISVSGPPSQVVGTTYQASATAGGADVALAYSLDASAPPWLSIDTDSGAISGVIPEGGPGYYSYEVTASDSAGSIVSGEQVVTVDEGSTVVALGDSAGGTVLVGTQVTYNATVSESAGSGALSGTLSFRENKTNVSNCQSLPLSGDSASCTITFTTAGSFNITASYQGDPYFSKSSASTIQEVVAAQVPAFTSNSATTVTVGSAFSFSVSTSGSPAPKLSESGSLPAGVTFETSQGSGSATLSGTPGAGTGGTYSFTLRASNSAGAATQAFVLSVNQPASFTSTSTTTAEVGSALSFKVTTSGYPAPSLNEAGSLPSGVTFATKSNGTAVLAGTPGSGTGGSYPITLSAGNGVGAAATQDFVLTVQQGPIFTSTSSTTAAAGTSFSFAVGATGSPTPTITEKGALPSGVGFEAGVPGEATISGTPVAGSGGIYSVTIKAANSAGSSSQSFTLTVDQSPAITSAASAKATAGTPFSFTITTTGFPASALSESGSLPSGLKFKPGNSGTAAITGTPATGTAGTYDLTVTASNGIGNEVTQSLVIKVKA